ncbi:MAG: acyl-CoA dehydrogenase family protein, partial [Ignavibacteriae bacterium]|nr:acyl-CoA dehydrogenase family protein [Ignavibacteriota bacterium]
MTKFQGVDYYNLDGLLSEEELLVRDTVREFVDDNVLPIIEKHNRAGTFPIDLVPKMAELGMFGSTLPAKYGCAEMNNVAYGLVMQELERGDSQQGNEANPLLRDSIVASVGEGPGGAAYPSLNGRKHGRPLLPQ